MRNSRTVFLPIPMPSARRGGRTSSSIFLLLMGLLMASSAAAAGLTIGLIPELNVFRQMKRYEPIADYVEKTAGIEIRFTVLPRYGNIIDSFISERLDGAFWGSFTGALAIRKLAIEPIARPLWKDGSSAYHGNIFVRKDSGITSVADMRGKSIAFVDRATTAGYVFPMSYLREHGVHDVESYFAEHYFAGSHDATITAVLEGKADVGCAKNTIYSLLAANDPRVEKELVILASSPEVPSNGLGLRSDLDPEVKRALADTLLGMHENGAGRAVLRQFEALRFIPTTVEDYEPVFGFARSAGIDLKTYQYMNE